MNETKLSTDRIDDSLDREAARNDDGSKNDSPNRDENEPDEEKVENY